MVFLRPALLAQALDIGPAPALLRRSRRQRRPAAPVVDRHVLARPDQARRLMRLPI
jgi:hypothetical protein